MSAAHGAEAEAAARHVAASLGLADFVYVPQLIHKGQSGQREIGDTLLIVGEAGAIVQVKARDPLAAALDSHAATERKIRAFVKQATSQARGTRREIIRRYRACDPVHVLPVRAFEFEPQERATFAVPLTDSCAHWPTVVIIDHPGRHVVDVSHDPDTFVISLDDWRGLYIHLRSVTHVLRYVVRMMQLRDEMRVPFGWERDRFATVAALDAWYAEGSRTWKPLVSYAAVDDPLAADLYRQLLEHVWIGATIGDPLTPEECRRILSFLDDAPPALQTHVGRTILAHRRALERTGVRSSGSIVLHDRPMVFMCDIETNVGDAREWRLEVAGLTMSRYAEWQEQMRTPVPILGIGVRLVGGIVEYTYVFGHGPSPVTGQIRRHYEWKYGVANFRSCSTHRLRLGRNDPCPCGSGRKAKRCHGAPGSEVGRQDPLRL